MIELDFDHGKSFALIYLLTITVGSTLLLLLANSLGEVLLKKNRARLTSAIFYGTMLLAFLGFLIIVGYREV